MDNQISYEEACKELSDIITKIEIQQLPLDEAIKLFERGQDLIKQCYKTLDKAQGKLTEIKETMNGFEEI